jgi:sulfatase modifying factor 1
MRNKLPITGIWYAFAFFCAGVFGFSKVGFSQPGFRFVCIPEGKYFVGKNGHVLNPARFVNADSFWISNTEITNQQFEEFVKATHYKTDAEKHHTAMVFEPGLKEFRWLEDRTAFWRFPNGRSRGGITKKMNHPVTTISYADATAYCNWANCRLPNLEEWEIASRALAKTVFAWGTEVDSLEKYGNVWHGQNHLIADSSDGYLYTAPVASFKPNAWGLYDMYGNVFEFCSGKLEKFKNNPKVVHARGGSWWCSKSSCNFFNSVDIGRVSIHASFSNQGFRVVRLNR